MTTETNNLPTFPDFRKHVCAGDTVQVEYKNLTIRALVHHDADCSPWHYPCGDGYTPEQITAWQWGEWNFVGIVLSVWLDDICIDDNAASLWGIECNLTDDNRYLTDCANEQMHEALGRADAALDKIRKAVA